MRFYLIAVVAALLACTSEEKVPRPYLPDSVVDDQCGDSSPGCPKDSVIERPSMQKMQLQRSAPQKPVETGWKLAYSSYEYDSRDLGGICGEPGVLPKPHCSDPCDYYSNPNLKPCVFAIEEELREGDSLKYVIIWRQPADTFGIADSVWYIFSSNAALKFYVGSTPAVNAKVKRSWKSPVLTDSFKLARPKPGVTANFVIDSFVQCRKGACSKSGTRAWKYFRAVAEVPAVAPPTLTPTIGWDSF